MVSYEAESSTPCFVNWLTVFRPTLKLEKSRVSFGNRVSVSRAALAADLENPPKRWLEFLLERSDPHFDQGMIKDRRSGHAFLSQAEVSRKNAVVEGIRLYREQAAEPPFAMIQRRKLAALSLGGGVPK